jgi:hypothetical protein
MLMYALKVFITSSQDLYLHERSLDLDSKPPKPINTTAALSLPAGPEDDRLHSFALFNQSSYQVLIIDRGKTIRNLRPLTYTKIDNT